MRVGGPTSLDQSTHVHMVRVGAGQRQKRRTTECIVLDWTGLDGLDVDMECQCLRGEHREHEGRVRRNRGEAIQPQQPIARRTPHGLYAAGTHNRPGASRAHIPQQGTCNLKGTVPSTGKSREETTEMPRGEERDHLSTFSPPLFRNRLFPLAKRPLAPVTALVVALPLKTPAECSRSLPLACI